MLLHLLIVSCVFSLVFYFFCYLPQRKLKQLARQAKQRNYKVLQLPYKFMSLSILEYFQQDDRSLQIFKQKFQSYDLIVGNMFTKVYIIPVHSDIIKDLLIQSSKLHKHPFFSQIFKLFNGGGIAFTEGEEWKRKRRIISSVFHFEFINQMIPTIQTEADQQFALIDERIKNGREIQLLPSISKILSTVVAKCFFGSQVNKYKIEGKSFCEYYISFLNELIYFGESFEHLFFGMAFYNVRLTSQSRKINHKLSLLKKVAREITLNELQKVENKKETHKNIITALYDSNMLSDNSEQNDPNKYTIDELIGQFFAFFAAGTDTTSNLINLILHYLSENPVYLQKVQQQLKQLKHMNLSQPQAFKRMKWVDAIYNQALRMNGPASELLLRVASQNMNAGGINISKGTTINIMPIICNYKTEVFQNPFEFRPERSMEGKNLPPYTYIPFSAGQRGCIGQYLAKIQTRILLLKIVEKYNFKAKNPIKMKNQWIYSNVNSQFDFEIKI